jgi:hypothetical protein
LRLSTPIALDALPMTVFASCAAAGLTSSPNAATAAIHTFLIYMPPETGANYTGRILRRVVW